MSEETIRLWEKGSVQPSVERLARLIALMSLETSDWPARSSPPTADLPPLARRLRSEREGRGHHPGRGRPDPRRAPGHLRRVGDRADHARRCTSSRRSAEFLGIAEQDVATLCSSPFVVDTTGWPPVRPVRRRPPPGAPPHPGAAWPRRSGVSQSTVVSWELGYRVPGSHAARRAWPQALSVDTASLAAALPRRVSATTLGELILARQRELGLRSADLARLTGTTEATVSRWVHGRSRPALREPPPALARP